MTGVTLDSTRERERERESEAGKGEREREREIYIYIGREGGEREREGNEIRSSETKQLTRW